MATKPNFTSYPVSSMNEQPHPYPQFFDYELYKDHYRVKYNSTGIGAAIARHCTLRPEGETWYFVAESPNAARIFAQRVRNPKTCPRGWVSGTWLVFARTIEGEGRVYVRLVEKWDENAPRISPMRKFLDSPNPVGRPAKPGALHSRFDSEGNRRHNR